MRNERLRSLTIAIARSARDGANQADAERSFWLADRLRCFALDCDRIVCELRACDPAITGREPCCQGNRLGTGHDTDCGSTAP